MPLEHLKHTVKQTWYNMENHYKAKEGMTYRRKVDGFIMGNELYLGKFIDGTDDVIENYEEVEEVEPKEE